MKGMFQRGEGCAFEDSVENACLQIEQREDNFFLKTKN